MAARADKVVDKGSVDTSDREIVLTRTFDARRELLWWAWTDPVQIGHWFGPKGFTTTTHAMDVRVGGLWRYTMHGPDGTDYPNWIRYREIVAPARLVYDHGGEGDGRGPAEFEVTVTFEEVGKGKTKLTMHSVFPTAAARDHVVKAYGAIEGGKQTLERLAQHLAVATATGDETLHVLSLTRVFNAPVPLVFQAWTDPKHVKNWWGPHGFTIGAVDWDAKPGNKLFVEMRWQDGTALPGGGEFLDVVTNERLVFTTRAFEDENGEPALEARNTVVFSAVEGNKTKVTLDVHVLRATPEMKASLGGMEEGWAESLEKLAVDIGGERAGVLTTMRGERVMVVTRTFDAPRALVFDAVTKPEHVPRWYGPRSTTMVSCTIDFRVGGRYRYVMRGADGSEFAFSGEYREIVRPERMVSTWWFEAIPGAETVDVSTFEDLGARTRMTVRVEFSSPEHLEGWALSGAETGMAETYDRLAELLQQLS